MKKTIITLIENIYLIKKYWKYYLRFYLKDKRKITKALKSKGLFNIKPTSKDNWKIWYDCFYFSANIYDENKNKKSVFVKVMGSLLKECYENEILLNEYIKNNSPYLYERTPNVYFGLNFENFYSIVYDFVKFESPIRNDRFTKEVNKTLNEYLKCAILHTDFGIVNIGINNGKYWFFDYGTSLCPLSNEIRIRNSEQYNHLDKITPQAAKLIPQPDFYYDDAAHLKIQDYDNSNLNFIVGKKDVYYAKLGETIYKYRLKQQSSGRGVCLLVKE